MRAIRVFRVECAVGFAVLVAAALVSVGGPISAAVQEPLVLFVNGSRITVTTTPDGIELHRINAAPVTTETGAVVGTAHMTRVVRHPTMPYYPTFLQVSNTTQQINISEVVSRDYRFRKSVSAQIIDNNSVNNFDSAIYEQGLVAIAIKQVSTEEAAGSFNNAFRFTRPRTDRAVADGGFTFRPDTSWFYVPGAGQTVPLGTNFGFAAGNQSHSFSVNVLATPDSQSGAVVTCYGTLPDCFFGGFGDYGAFLGSAASLTPGSLGVVADALSRIDVRARNRSIVARPPGCPAGFGPPPPTNLLGITNAGNQTEFLQWDSVPCALSYVVRVEKRDGSTDVFEVEDTFLSGGFAGGVQFEIVRFQVATRVIGGLLGPFSETTETRRVQSAR